MKVFEIIAEAKQQGCWRKLMFVDRIQTLDTYYRIYCFVQKHEPERKYRYTSRLFKNEEFAAFAPKDRFGAFLWDATTIYWAIQEMEREVFVE